MDTTKLIDLKRKIFLRSALIPVDGLQEIFELNNYFSGDELLGELFKKSLRNFEFHHPIIHESKVTIGQLCSCSKGDGWCEIKNNFKLWLDCILPEDRIILVPNATPKIRLSGSYPGPGAYNYPIEYMRPYIFLGNFTYSNEFYIRGVCSRPIILDYKKDKTFSPKAGIYWLNIEEGVLGQKFLDQCMVDVLEYVRNLKGNLTLPNFSVDIFGAVDVAYQQLKQELDSYYLQSVWRGDLLV